MCAIGEWKMLNSTYTTADQYQCVVIYFIFVVITLIHVQFPTRTPAFSLVSNDFSTFLMSHSSPDRNAFFLFKFLLFSNLSNFMYTLKFGLIVCVHGKISIQGTCSLCTEQIYSKLGTTGRFRFSNTEIVTATKTKYTVEKVLCTNSNFLYVIHNSKRMTAQPKLFSMLQTFFLHIFFSFFFCSFSFYEHTYLCRTCQWAREYRNGREKHI